MHQLTNNTKGETILETLIALTILSIGVVMSATIIGSSIRNVNASKNRIIAINVAREVIEGIRNVRDTNWLKFSARKRDCWNHIPNVPTCDGTDPILPGKYLVYKREGTRQWLLDDTLGRNPVGRPEAPSDGYIYTDTNGITYYFDVDKWRDISSLFLVDVDLNYDTDGDRNLTNDKDAYNNIWTGADDALGKANATKTVFSRHVVIEYIANNGDIITGGLTDQHNRMRITAHVSWQEGKNRFSTSLSTHITDYLGRQVLSN